MKKITFVFSLLVVLLAHAQYTGPGFYRVHNVGSDSYICIKGTKFNKTTRPDAFWPCVLMQKDHAQVVSDPGSIIYIPDTVQTSLCSQGVSTLSLTGLALDIDFAKVNEGGKLTYIAMTYSQEFFGGHIPCIFRDCGNGFTAGSSDKPESRWWIEPVNEASMDSSYFGLTPVNSVTADEGTEYWATLCCDFPCLIPEGGSVEGAYTVNRIYNGKESTAMVKPIKRYGQGDTIPGATPVLIKCTSTEAKDNKLVPVGEIANHTTLPITADLLMGNYFSIFTNHGHLTDYTVMTDYLPEQSTPASNNYLALGIDENGTIGFFPKEEGTYMDANTAWLDVTTMTDKNVSAVYFVVNGDGNGDGRCDMDDLSLIINYLLNSSYEPTKLSAASFSDTIIGLDIDENGQIDMDDLSKLINYLLTNS